MDMPDDGTRTEGGRVLSLTSLATFASEPLTTKDFFALDVDEKIKVELIGGALSMSPSARPWHAEVATSLLMLFHAELRSRFKVFTDLDVTLNDDTVVRPDVFITRADNYQPDRVTQASDVLLAVEIVSPGSRINDRRVKPDLYRNAGIPSWRVERDGHQLYLVETPVHGEDQHHLGAATLDVAGTKITVDLRAIAEEAFGKPSA